MEAYLNPGLEGMLYFLQQKSGLAALISSSKKNTFWFRPCMHTAHCGIDMGANPVRCVKVCWVD